MRALVINPFDRTVKRVYHECELAIVNFHVQSEELMKIPLGQEHAVWLDLHWAVREKQAFWTLNGNPDGVLGGRALITGHALDGDVLNCAVPESAMLNQMVWVEPEQAALHSVVQGLRREVKGYLPRQSFTYPEIVMITKANAERSDTVN